MEDSNRGDNSVSRGRASVDFALPDDKLLDDRGQGFFSQIKRVLAWAFLGHGGQWDHETSNYPGSISHSSSVSLIRPTSLARSHQIGLETGQHVIDPRNRFYLVWEQVMLLLCMYSSCIAPFEFAFFRRLPVELVWMDISVNFFFLVDLVLTFFVAYKDRKTYVYVEDHEKIAVRYLKTGFIIDLLNLIPWDLCYKAAGGTDAAEFLRWLQFLRMFRAIRVDLFFDRLERDIRISYYAVRIFRLLVVEFFCTHVAGCFFYYLATTVPAENETDTWIGSLSLGSNSYENFRELDLGRRYVTSLYWSVVTMATVGYGDIHPVNPREMIFCMCFISFDMVLSAYLIGNITALIVKGSSTEKYRDRVTLLVKYMNRYRLPRALRRQMREHVRLQFETDQVESDVLDEFPMSIRHKVARTLFRETVEKCYLFAACSSEFIDQIVARACPETFMPMEVVFQQRDAADNMYILVEGVLEEIEEGVKEPREIYMEDAVGEVAVVCNIPQPFTVCVKEVARVLRVEKQVFDVVISTYIRDGRQVVDNLLQRAQEEGSKVSSLADEIMYRIEQREAELIMTTINAAARGDVFHLTQLVAAGANPSKPDYDGRTALHLAASKGYDEMVSYLIREKADVNARDNLGTTPLLEALRMGHDNTASLLVEKGGTVSLQEAGTELCNAVIHGNVELLRRLLDHGVDPNSADYDLRTPLHISAAEGFLVTTQVLLAHGADAFARDRWGNTPLDDAQRCGSKPVMKVIEAAMVAKAGVSAVTKEPAPSLSQATATSTDRTLALAAAAVSEVKQGQDKVGSITDSTSLEKEVGEGEIGVQEPTTTSQKKTHLSQLKVAGGDFSGGLEGSPRREGGKDGGVGVRSGVTSPRLPYGRTPRSRGAGGIALGSEPARKRATIYPYHPWSGLRKPGRLVFIPATLEEFITLGSQQFGEAYTRILNVDGGEIRGIELVLDGDRLYLANDEDPEPSETTSLLG